MVRIGVIGAGAVGGAIAALLSRQGHEVEVTARGAHLESIREHGIRLSGAWGSHLARVAAGQTLSRAPELTVVATKAADAAEAIRANLAMIDGSDLIIVQNGLEGISVAGTISPRSEVVGCLATFASSYLSPGQIAVTTAGPSYLGVAAGEDERPAHKAARVLGEVMPVSVVSNSVGSGFLGAQWTKLVINQINALPAITGRSAQEVIAEAGLRRIMTASMRENVRIGLACQIRFGTLQGLSHAGLRLFAALPLWLGQLLPRLMSHRIGETPNPGSTLQSIRRGQATEIDYLNGAVVRAAQAIGRSAPVNAALVGLVHEVESTGRFFSPAEVERRLS